MLQMEDHRRVCMYATIPEGTRAPLDSGIPASCKPKQPPGKPTPPSTRQPSSLGPYFRQLAKPGRRRAPLG